jgi:flavin reductase (DIM6/NTAB) family NADH-FMN oxidoreductase RutF
LYFGTPVALISSENPDGSTNLSPMSSAWALGDRLVLGLGTAGQCLRNLERTSECVVNLPDASLWDRVERIAPTTGRADVPEDKRAMGYQFDPDKFRRAGLSPLPSELVGPARVAECPLQLEARVLAMHAPASLPGAEAADWRIVEVQVLRVHAHDQITRSESDHIDVVRWRPLLYVFRHYVAAGEVLGRNFRAP